MLTRLVRIQLIIFTIASVIGVTVMAVQYLQVQSALGIGRINVTLDLPNTGGLYRFSNVTYRGVEVGEVTGVELTEDGVRATMSLNSSPEIPQDLDAYVRSVSAVGEQYVDLRPRTDSGPYLHDGSKIRAGDDALSVPVGPMLDQLSALVSTIPKEKLNSLLDELFLGFNGSAFDLQSLLDSAARLSADLNPVGDQARILVEDTRPLLDSQVQSVDAIRIWTASLAGVTDQLVLNDPQVRTVLQKGPGFANQVSALLHQLKFTVPVLLSNLITVGQLAVVYNPALEQALVLLPLVISGLQFAQGNRNASGLGLGSFRLSGISDPPACTVGFLPPSAWRPPYDTTSLDAPDDMYCKLPQDSPVAVRGMRNIPCMRKPGKRAPTAEICNSDQEYEPLAKRQPVVGPYPRDPNLDAQGIQPDSRWFPDQGLYAPPGLGPPAPGTPNPVPPIPPEVPPPGLDMTPPQAGNSAQVPPIPPPPVPPGITPPPPDIFVPPDFIGPHAPPPPPGPPPPAAPSGYSGQGSPATPAVSFAPYNPRTGQYVGPDGQVYTQTDLVNPGAQRTLADLVVPS